MPKDRIIVWQVYPPIPTNRFDYAAYWDGFEEGDYGWGATKELAKRDLLDNYEHPTTASNKEHPVEKGE